MSIIGSNILAGASGQAAAAAGGYEISRSVRFNSADSAYLSRTPGSAGNRKTWTWAGWVKRSAISSGSYMDLFTALTGANDFTEIRYHFNANDDALMFAHVAGGTGYYVYSSNLFRDPSSWYHIVVAIDTTQSTSTDRVKIYVNGSQVTQNTSGGGYPVQNSDTSVNATAEHRHGSINTYGRFFSGLLAEIHFIDSQALTPSAFGEFDTNGVWQPIEYTGTFGTNGFHLPFSDNSTAAALGTDTSSNGNTWTVNNISVTAGSGNDSLVDTPTNGSQVDTGVGGEVVGNYATLNPLDNDGNSLTNGNLELAGSGNNYRYTRSSIYVASGKWYWECLISATGGQTVTGPQILRASDTLGAHSTGNIRGYIIIYDYIGTIYVLSNPNGSNTTLYSTSGSLPAGTIVGIALDATNGKLWISVNGTWLNSGNPDTDSNPVATGLTGPYTPGGWAYYSSDLLVYNFGQRPFAYSSNHTSFKALCTTNLPEPTIADGSTVMDVALYTGNGSTQTISGLNFSPDFVWIKRRDSAAHHVLYDQIRGAGANKELVSSGTFEEGNTSSVATGQYGYMSAFTSDGFSVAAGTVNGTYTNLNASTYTAWTWDAGSSTVTNTEGSITSQVRANASAGFSVVTYTGTGANATVGHGLGVAPGLIIVKQRSTASSNGNWAVQHQSLGATKNLILNSTAAADGPDAGYWNSTSPTSSVFSVGTYEVTNRSTATYVAYCFAPVAGYSSFGSYTGNGSADGPFVYTGFRPAFVLMKRSDSTSYWWILDNKRSAAYNVTDGFLYPNGSGVEAVAAALDLLSNGFKMRRTGPTDVNASGGTYVWAAFAENPFQYARAR